jgi:flagellar M-ring protein FliF
VNYQRALEGELEHTVGSFSDVESARVHLVLPHDSLFREQDRPAKASVVLKLRHRSLAEGEPDAIRNLVASAVDGLAPDRVVLADAAGRVPLGPRTPEAARLGQEQALEEKLVATLEPVTGPGTEALNTALNYVSSQRVVLDNSLTRLTAASDAVTTEQTQLTAAQTNLMQADLPGISTQLSLDETQQTALEDVIAQLGSGTLFDKLPVGG